ncbi:hypothetical protein M8994_22530, partial [Brucella sp. 21LCYQ03]|nr:hypothetical protein [Brucella sp. 21LCYQ03]
IGFVGDVAGLCTYSADGLDVGFLLLNEDGSVNSGSAQFSDNNLSLSYSVSVAEGYMSKEVKEIGKGQITINDKLGDLKLSEDVIKEIGDSRVGSVEVLQSSAGNRFYVNNYTSSRNGLISSIRIRHASAAVGTDFVISQLRFDSEGQLWREINTISLKSTVRQNWATYPLPNGNFRAGDV